MTHAADVSRPSLARMAPPAPPLGFVSLLALGGRPLAWAIVTAVASAALSIAPFWLIYRMVAALSAPAPDMAMIWQLGGWALGLLLLRWLLMAASHVLAHTGAFAIQHHLRLALARRLGEVPLSFFAGRGTGSLRRTLTDDVNGLEGFFAHMLPDTVAAATAPLAALALLCVADWRLALATLAPLPPALLVQWWWLRRAGQRTREWSALQKQVADQVGEYLRGVHVVKTFGLDARSFGELATAIRSAVDWVAEYARSGSTGWVVFNGLLSSSLVLVAPLGAWLLLQGELDRATWVLFLLVAPAVLLPLLRLTFAMGEQMRRAEALARINAILQAPPLAEAALAPPPAGTMLDIEFADIRHCYGARLALDGVSLRAEAGRLTAIVGASGAGKSTLARLVARLYEFESGSLKVGGLDIRDWPLDALLARLGIVFQEVFLFHGSVRENLALARPDATQADIEAAARAACAHQFIMALPQGYDTQLGERGARLSGGERQRLSITRALLKDAPILLLDEPTASVDGENEADIRQALDRVCQGRTVLLIAHRLHTVIDADHIVVLEQGRVAGQGRHAGLLDNCPAYQALWRDYQQAQAWSLGADTQDAGATR